ncbi:MAG: DUF58 domain-containing protein, partial [Lentisphaeraceae bacterium]|nr:DUF58 domain-containing protein [Lentisphaeraceae bacterium]
MKLYKKIHRFYYAGPRKMGAIRVPRFLGYKSFILTMLHWCTYFINRSLTLIGRIIILICSLLLSYCLLDPDRLLMGIIAFGMVGMYAVNLIIGFIFKPRVELFREMPLRAICRSEISVKYKIVNKSFLPSWDVKLDNLAYQGMRYTSCPTISVLAPREVRELQSSLSFKNRGLYRLPCAFAESAYPFGLWKWGRFGSGDREVRVMPQAIKIENLDLPFHMGENAPVHLIANQGSGMEFTSCREFRFGDNPRHIHWASWAKTGSPIIREMSEEGRPEI